MSIYSDKLSQVQVVNNCRYFVAQLCTGEDILARISETCNNFKALTHLNNGPVNLLSRNRNEDPNTGPWAQVVQYLNDQLPKWHRNLVLLFMGVMNSTSGRQGHLTIPKNAIGL